MPLLLVLWGIGLVSLMAVALSGTSLTSQKIARNTLQTAQTDAIAEAALIRAVVGLTDPRPNSRWLGDGRTEDFRFIDTNIRINIQDELGRIDLNYADRALLAGLFRSVGVDVESANRIVEAILEWRRPAGSGSDTLRKGKPDDVLNNGYHPRHGLFQSVDELNLVPGITPRLFNLVAPALTVYSRGQTVDLQLAPREVLLALPDMSLERVSQFLGARMNREADSLAPSLRGHAFSLRIDLARPGGPARYEAVVRITDDPKKPYWLLYWKHVSF